MKKYNSYLTNLSRPNQLFMGQIRSEKTLRKQQYELDTIKQLLLKTPSYIIVAEGMGCYSIVRRKSPEYFLEALFVDTDDNDYNYKTSKFTEEYTMVNTNPVIYHEWFNYE